jgi:formaldehyde-activating enzyme involved in methanogenesis
MAKNPTPTMAKLLNSGNYATAKALNDAIVTTLLPENNQKDYNSIIINHYTRMQSTPNH